MQRKLKEYFSSGVSLVWVVSPDERTVTVQNSEAESRLLREDDTLDGGHLLPGFQLPLSRLFSELDRKAVS